MKNIIITALVAIIAIGGALGAFAATRTVETTANVEVTVWQRVSDGALYLSTRPEDGSWTTHQTALDMSAMSRSGNYRQGSAITVGVPVSITVDVPDASTPTATATATATPTETSATHTHSYSRCRRTRNDGGCDQRFRPTTYTVTYQHTHSSACTHSASNRNACNGR